jgi:hypothetical protein
MTGTVLSGSVKLNQVCFRLVDINNYKGRRDPEAQGSKEGEINANVPPSSGRCLSGLTK